MSFQIVIDTSVMVAAARSRSGASFELLRLFETGDARWEWNISTALLVEYEAVLKREQHRQGRDLAGCLLSPSLSSILYGGEGARRAGEEVPRTRRAATTFLTPLWNWLWRRARTTLSRTTGATSGTRNGLA